MKVKNMPRRKLLRQIKAYRRKFAFGVLHTQSHEAFVLHGVVPNEVPTELFMTDIRIRMKAGDRRKVGHYSGNNIPKRR